MKLKEWRTHKKRGTIMYKVSGINELAQIIESNDLIERHERQAKKALIKQRINELVSQGIELQVAKVMANIEYDYQL